MSQDTPQQKAILRQSATARKVRKMYPEGTRVAATVSDMRGTVKRHVPGTNAQGGYLVVEWDSGNTGRCGAAGLMKEI
jgi:hypothetical protein